ncbi:hypothetical protein SEA_BISKIT_52 [Gordonia phage Biskit]|uniref:Uncharacterized protein n=1 Tax=Gordonia phage SketchMex TaxID=2250418 RepID=A0A345KQ48_9CAUD|nr:hypothetical protein SEA_SKETCHMEX_50 [Gordonia phage SketchMex]UVK62091.1 hypothetical protein SEA_BISKIT_52 [Gordonia phage Biskit]
MFQKRSKRFIARYGGKCSLCLSSIHIGQWVEYDEENKLAHYECPDKPNSLGELVMTPDPQAYGDLCPACYLYHRGDCG